MNTMNKIQTWRGETSNHYETSDLCLIIEKDKTRRSYLTVKVSKLRFKCVGISRSDAKDLLVTMIEESKNPTT